MVIHLSYIKKNKYNGYNTGTVCGLNNQKSIDGTNSTQNYKDVTCKKCLAIIANKNNWRHIKFITNSLDI